MIFQSLGSRLTEFGVDFRDLILSIANWIVAEHWPGLISATLISALLVCMLLIWWIASARVRVLRFAQASILRAANGAVLDVGKLEADLSKSGSSASKQLATAFSEFRETLLEPGEKDNIGIRNAIRPSAFLNIDDLSFSLKGWRFAPGIFVSTGLLLTFLGLVAVLNTTQAMLNPDDTTVALKQLLGQASAKFIMSLTGLACSIVLNLWLKFWSARVESGTERLANLLERRMDFVSLEGLADHQLKEIRKQTSDMHELNTNLIAALSEPLRKVSESSLDNVGAMVDQLSKNITSGIGGSMDTVSERMEAAANALVSVGDNLTSASNKFDESLTSATNSLGETLSRLEVVSEKLSVASGAVSEMAPTVLETIKEGNAANMRVAEGATVMVNAAKNAISDEKQVVLEAMAAIRKVIETFEGRAAAYDGQLEAAFKTYQLEVGKTIDRLEDHGSGVQERFADALSTLQAVIENAKSFEPESVAEPVHEDFAK
ncbi:methyl-accepting chemotaxis protein [Sulfitobacter sp. M220]|jgi:hypothetical protein|uniref:hypothetical protein n=1 Tax=Sulfitobacter sp. M220 TaxID=2675333 RepID=UPI001F48F3F8|nr:hypothetical protein [Sulfitobacter sp. M220]MCF7777436.1 methyl-accepting chemotaxis protein [Sulfitobacter sp. M220]